MAGATPDDDRRLETVRLDAVTSSAGSPDVGHRLIARRLLRAGQPDEALSALIRFSRELPMTARMACALTTLALTTKKTGPIATLLTQGTEETEGRERVGVMRALARLQRRTGQVEAAIETLSVLLAEAAEDRRSRHVLNALLQQQGQWEALDASLDKDTRLLLKRRYFRAASRTAVRRARLWAERLEDPARAALRYGQAAQYAEQGQDPHSVFLIRMLWLRALVDADAPGRTLDEGMRVTLEAAARVGREARARAFIRELGLSLPVVAAVVEEPVDVTASGEVPATHASTTISDFEAASSEPVPKGPMGEALLAANPRSSAASMEALSRLEARYVAQGAWTELARFYRQTAEGRPPDERAGWLEKLAELIESELDDPVGAAGVWAEVAQLTGDAEAVSEQVRILDERKDQAGVRQALDAGVGRAQSPAEKARLLALRAQEARQRGDLAAARADFEAALKVVPGTLEAAAGLAELSVARRDLGPLRSFERVLVAASRQLPERPALFRRLARLADQVRDARMAVSAWTEVLTTAPQDDEALDRSLMLARALKDDARLELVTRAVVGKDPRGLRARAAWLDLVAVLERAGKPDEALVALREAVKAEPGHLEAWLALVDRLVAKGLDAEAAWAMEHASTAAPEGPGRVALWRRLARHARERLSDDEKAEKYEDRLERVRIEQTPAAHAAPGLPGGPLVVPVPRASRPKLAPAPPRSAKDEAESDAFAKALGAEREPEDTREMPNVIPPRLQHVLEPILKDVETREAPADDFIDDDDIDEVMDVRSDEVEVPSASPPAPRREADPATTPVPPSGPSLRLQTGRDESLRATLPTRPAPVWREEAPPAEDEVTVAPSGAVASLRAPSSRGPSEDEVTVAHSGDERGRTAEIPAQSAPALGDPLASIPPSFGPSPSKLLSDERQALFEQVRANPLEPDGYRMLAEHFDTANDANRSTLMLELARALEGDPNAAPRTPKLILSATDRAGLRHPLVRNEAAELVSLATPAMCRLFPAKGKDAVTTEEFSLERGKGAQATADALLAAVRLLGMRAPDVFVSDEVGPPFTALHALSPRLVVSRLAVKKALPDAELRFYAGRALFTLSPELLALRTLKRDQLKVGLEAVGNALRGHATTEARLIRDALSPRSLEKLKALWPTAAKTIDLGALMEGARHSVNRAGLVVCGGIAPVIESLRAKKALPIEVTELVRFAASERYLQLRNRRLGKK
jgi:tetratricopeptide (TPR) repeat protein